MPSDYTIKTIAHIHSEFPDKFGIPRQSGLVADLRARILFEPEYQIAEAFKGLEDFSHIWLIWGFSENLRNSWSPSVRPPRLGGNIRMGVFATRAPFRPNPLGLSCVKLEAIEFHPVHGPVLHVSGADLMDGTPIFDIKPYVPYVDSHPEAAEGFGGPHKNHHLTVRCPEEWLDKIPESIREKLFAVLAQDPRPSYQNDPERIYGLRFSGLEVKFRIHDTRLTICSVEPDTGSAADA
ncbi:tRNA (N6-threonylcarbamoyladenosine(37)-N6)-methyltransferase TrmO [Frisingicoccus sp.]|uniref:tRNA (N6-threonylcarbamoyladenosine(37)-N6)-methyltransferase TrmO n=1 Tax=Frisingicoccus sp. TaxID=1918627 RepID=UPI003AB262DD